MAYRDRSIILDLPLPAQRHLSLGLFLFRRMAVHGLQDARATLIAMDAAGGNFRKLLALSRSLVIDLATNSLRTITLAPCCATGMTRDEGLLVALIAGGGLDAHAALTHDSPCRHAISLAHAYGEELAKVAERNGWRT